MNSVERLKYPDTLKGVAVLLMIQVHIIEVFSNNVVTQGVTGQLILFLGGIPAAPVFMLLMGYFAVSSSRNSIQTLSRGVRLFFGGIILNFALNLNLIAHVLFQGWEYNIWHYILGADILSMAGLSFIFLGLIRYFAGERYLIYLILSFTFAIISNLFGPYQFEEHPFKYILSFIIGGTSWSYFPLIPWISYPLAGYGIKLSNDKYKLSEKLRTKFTMIIILTLLLIVIFKFDFGYSNSIFLAFYYHHNFLFYIWAFAFLAVWFYVWYFIDYKYGNLKIFKFLQFSGQNLTKIYVIQWLLIGNIGTEIYKTKNLTECIIWYFIILILTGLLTYTFNVSSKYLKHIKNKRLVFGTSKK